MLESSVERAFLRHVKRRGWWAPKAETLLVGFPDRILFGDGRVWLVELKRPGVGHRLRTGQRLVRRRLRRLGIHVYVLSTPEEVEGFFAQC